MISYELAKQLKDAGFPQEETEYSFAYYQGEFLGDNKIHLLLEGRPNGKLALIIGPYQKNWQTTDLAFMCYQAITKYLVPIIRIQVPYPTQVHGGKYINNAKEAKQMLYLSRDLMIFSNDS